MLMRQKLPEFGELNGLRYNCTLWDGGKAYIHPTKLEEWHRECAALFVKYQEAEEHRKDYYAQTLNWYLPDDELTALLRFAVDLDLKLSEEEWSAHWEPHDFVSVAIGAIRGFVDAYSKGERRFSGRVVLAARRPRKESEGRLSGGFRLICTRLFLQRDVALLLSRWLIDVLGKLLPAIPWASVIDSGIYEKGKACLRPLFSVKSVRGERSLDHASIYTLRGVWSRSVAEDGYLLDEEISFRWGDLTQVRSLQLALSHTCLLPPQGSEPSLSPRRLRDWLTVGLEAVPQEPWRPLVRYVAERVDRRSRLAPPVKRASVVRELSGAQLREAYPALCDWLLTCSLLTDGPTSLYNAWVTEGGRFFNVRVKSRWCPNLAQGKRHRCRAGLVLGLASSGKVRIWCDCRSSSAEGRLHGPCSQYNRDGSHHPLQLPPDFDDLEGGMALDGEGHLVVPPHVHREIFSEVEAGAAAAATPAAPAMAKLREQRKQRPKKLVSGAKLLARERLNKRRWGLKR